MSRLPRLPRAKRGGGGAKRGEFVLAVCGPLSGIASPLEPAASTAWRATRNDIPATEHFSLKKSCSLNIA